MSSRGLIQEIGPKSGQYVPKPTPSESEDMPTYINDELLHLGGIVNGILEGGSLPPQSELPARVREGMIIYFSRKIPDTEIFSAGVYLYREGRWWKIIDDPSQIEGIEQIFRTTGFSTPPPTPNPSATTPPGWDEEPQQKPDKSYWTWVCINASHDPETGVNTWSDPVAWSAGVEDGEDGAEGPPGIAGDTFEQWFKESPFRPPTPTNYPPTGWSSTTPENPTDPVWSTYTRVSPDGTWTPFSVPIRVDGVDGQRGFLGIVIDGNSWNDQAAWDAIVAETTTLNPPRPVPWDNVTIQNPATGFVETRRYVDGVEPGNWAVVELVVDGDAIVNGTLAGNKIISNSITSAQIAADTITGNEINAGTRIVIGGNSGGQDVIVLDGTDPNNRLWIGNLSSGNANFRVDTNGVMYAQGGVFDGEIFAENLTGDVTDSIVKTVAPKTWNTGDSSTEHTMFTINVQPQPFARYISVATIKFIIETSPSLRVRLRDNLGNVYSSELLTSVNSISSQLFAGIGANQSKTLYVTAEPTQSTLPGNIGINSQDILVSAFKKGSTIS